MATNQLIMIRPACFGSNPETLADNVFQQQGTSNENVSEIAIDEFDTMVSTLRSKDIEVLVLQDQGDIETPDAVFPNNWFSTHADGKLVLYPMMSKVRRNERREEFLTELKNKFEVEEYVDLSSNEELNFFLEGTGSMVLDDQSNIAYMCSSERSSEEVFKVFCEAAGYKPHIFHAIIDERPVYHTNVIMSVGDDFVIACLASIAEQEAFRESVRNSNKALIEITVNQVKAFLGNCLEVLSRNGEKYLVISEQAFLTLTREQKDRLSNFATLLPISIPIIEKYGGGSVRCMLAENYLKKKEKQIHA